MRTFKSTLDDIEKLTKIGEWKTDTGHTLQGTLVCKGDRVSLSVNTKSINETIDFQYLYHEDPMWGGKRIIYPFDIKSSKYIPRTESGYWSIEVFMIVDEQAREIPKIANQITFTYDSFIWDEVPVKAADRRQFRNLLSKIQNMQTSAGVVSVYLQVMESHSLHPSSYSRRMDEIIVTFDPIKPLSNDEILMWNTRFGQLLTLLHKERVTTRSIEKGINNITVPSLIENYKEADYAYRDFITCRGFVDFIGSSLPVFVDKYDKIATFIEDLVQYYRDYPLDPPDNIQLLRLFTSLEQCSNYAQKTEKILKKGLSVEQSKRQKEFTKLLDKVKSEAYIPQEVRDYLRNIAQGFYVSSGSLAAPKHKITALAKFISKKYEVYNELTYIANVEVILKMRNIVAHGFYDPKSRNAFYARRDAYGQAIEECLRIYTFHALGCPPRIVKMHKDPLKARQFNL